MGWLGLGIEDKTAGGLEGVWETGVAVKMTGNDHV
jgi:hypothetical protein